MNSGNNGNPAHMAVAILAGGSGTRLWPISTPSVPKPFVPLGPLGTLYGEAVSRAKALKPRALFTVGAGPLKRFCTSPDVDYLEEPGARNTAPAVALAAVKAYRDLDGEGVLLILPSDHHIAETHLFAATVGRLADACRNHAALGIMGIRPTGPETGYGYIEQGEAAGDAFRVSRFIEKPDRPKAEALLAAGRVAWNSGMFCLPLGVLREDLAEHCPGYWEACEAWLDRTDATPYLSLPNLSVDYALMEKTRRLLMVPAEFTWSDLGTFKALHAALPKDEHGNAGWGPGRVEACRDCLVVTRRPQTLVRSLSGAAVVETEDGLLTSDLESSEGIRSGVEAILKGSG